MALSEDRIVYGIHSIAPYRRSGTQLPYGILKVLGGGTISLAAEFEDLFGGSNKFQFASEPKTITSEFTSSVKSMPDFMFELFLGASITTTAASATGTVLDAIANKKGTSVQDGTTGIASVAIAIAADAKHGVYYVEAASATTVDVYHLTDIDHLVGTDAEYQNDILKITTVAITVPGTGGTVAIPNTGLELTGGSGAIAFVTGDIAEFTIAKPHAGVSEITVGQAGVVFEEHGLVMLSAKRSNGDLFELEAFKALGAGFPIALEETIFAIPELTTKLLFDSVVNAVFKIRAVKAE